MITIKQLKTIIALGEGFSTEFKKSASDKKSIGKEICALFMGTTKLYILDRLKFAGDLYGIFEEVSKYLFSKLNTELIITARGSDERLELPPDALREAIVNAIAHQDYRSAGLTQIYIFSDRVEIVSPGGLPAGMTQNYLGVKSIPRDPEKRQYN